MLARQLTTISSIFLVKRIKQYCIKSHDIKAILLLSNQSYTYYLSHTLSRIFPGIFSHSSSILHLTINIIVKNTTYTKLFSDKAFTLQKEIVIILYEY